MKTIVSERGRWVGLVALILAVALLFHSSSSTSQPVGPNPQTLPGQSLTLLPDGRILLLGGHGSSVSMREGFIFDPKSGITTPLASQLSVARAWHTATVLPDGKILILGGVGSDGHVLASPEFFDPRTLSFSPSSSSFTMAPRAHHTATLLTDGRLIVAGGVGSNSEALATAELFDPLHPSSLILYPSLNASRQGHTATLLSDGRVSLAGGTDAGGSTIETVEIFDPSQQTFTSIPQSEFIPPQSDAPFIEASLPIDGAVEVPADSLIALRFSKPLQPYTLNSETVSLSGPNGLEQIKVVPAEGGMLAFITPESPLMPGGTYSVTVNGGSDQTGLLLPISGFSFTTQPSAVGGQPSEKTKSQTATSSSDSDTGNPKSEIQNLKSDDWEWLGAKKDGKPHSPWQDLSPLQAEEGVTALAGQVLDLKGEPLANVTLEIEAPDYSSETTVKTDETGRFLLKNISAGWSELVIDGRNGGKKDPKSENQKEKWGYGLFEYGLDIKEGQTNVLPFTIWLPKIDAAHAVKIASPTTSEVVVTNPHIPGLELRIPPNTVIYDEEGEVVTEVTLTPIPVDRPPFPLAQNIEVPIYFTAQPGGAYLYGSSGARVVYPNHTKELPGARFNFWHYTTGPAGWYIYGMGTVTEDGKQIVPDPGVGIYKFSGAMINTGLVPSIKAVLCKLFGVLCKGGEPVDLTTGLFVMEKTDLFLPDIMPLKLTRTYVTRDNNARPFGVGMTHPYAIFLWSAQQYQQADLILPDQGRIHYVRISPGTGWTDAVFEHTSSQTAFYKSTIRWNGNGWDLALKDGTVYVFGANTPLQAIRDRYGNQITITWSNGQSGNITKVTSPNGRWIEFTYDTSNRITQAKDNSGRTVGYTYDATGRLWKVTDPNNGVTEYTYDASHRMLTIKDARSIVFLTNEYDANGRVFRQTQPDTTTFQFAYTLDAGNNVTQTDLTDPRGKVRRVTFNSSGYPLTDTYGLGTPEAQTITYERPAGANLLLSVTDPLNRKTSYTYDSMGNPLTVTRLADTPDAVTTTFTYEPTFNQVASVTDPLNHTTNFGYDALGNLTSITDPLNHTTTLTYNSAGQPISITPPAPAGTTQVNYDFGDLVSIIDPLGNTTSHFVDALGRLVSVTNPLGLLMRYSYDSLNRVTQTTDPLAGVTGFTYDPNGNLLTVTDARNKTTTYTYNNMDRLETRQDPLLKTESYQYDNNGNLSLFTDRKLQPTNSTFDALNRRTGVTYADSSTTTYTYDAGNRLTQVVDSVSGTITRTFDGLNRLTSETTPQGSVSYTYDSASRRSTMIVAGQPTVNYTYDDANRLTQITQGSSVVNFGYDNANRRSSLTLPNALLVEYAYDAASRITGITYKQGATVLGDLTYEYDQAGNRTKIGGSWARTGLPQNLATTNYDSANRQLMFGDKTLTYDDNGNLTSITDANGTTLYTWNARNQLTSITGPNVNASFVYDAFGRREKKTVNGSLTEILFDGINPVQETSGATVLANMLSGLGIDEYFTRTDACCNNQPPAH